MHQSELEQQVVAQKKQIDAMNRRLEELQGQFQAENLALNVNWNKISGLLDERDARIAATNTKLDELKSEVRACDEKVAAVQDAAENRSWEDDNLMTALRLAIEATITRLHPHTSAGILNELKSQAALEDAEPYGHEYYLEQIIEGAQAALADVKTAA